MKRVLPALLLAMMSLTGFAAQEFYVDNVRGNDENPGTKEAPFRSFKKALDVMTGGSTLHLVPNEIPYDEPILINHWNCTHTRKPGMQWDGTAENPTVIDGHGSVIDLRAHIPASDWRSEGDDVFSMILHNNAGVMSSQGYWSGFPIVFIDGVPLPWKKNRAELTENSYFLCVDEKKRFNEGEHQRLYVKLPKGKTPADCRIVTPHPVYRHGFANTGCAYVTVRNLTCIYSHNDAFDNYYNKGFVFENVCGAYCMDQGTSAHCAQGVVRNSRFHHNAGCGIVDCFMSGKPSSVEYYDCIIEDNVFRGAADLCGPSEFRFDRCIFRNNDGSVRAYKSKARFTDCVFLGKTGDPVKKAWYRSPALSVTVESDITLKNCTFYDTWCAISYYKQPAENMRISNCLFVNSRSCMTLAGMAELDDNAYCGEMFFILGHPDKKTGYAEMLDFTKKETRSVRVEKADDPAEMKRIEGKGFGASDAMMKKALAPCERKDFVPLKQ